MNPLSKLLNVGLLMMFSAALLLATSACNRETHFPEPRLEPGSLSSRDSNILVLDNEITGRLTRKNSNNTYTVTVVEEGLYQFDMRSDKL
ncbi:MAG: hypothetical protein LBV45_09275, partial [Xanthomonadaceae bacterium]|nr:hypothetical protein [Xanthomonadaceae bacterium]